MPPAHPGQQGHLMPPAHPGQQGHLMPPGHYEAQLAATVHPPHVQGTSAVTQLMHGPPPAVHGAPYYSPHYLPPAPPTANGAGYHRLTQPPFMPPHSAGYQMAPHHHQQAPPIFNGSVAGAAALPHPANVDGSYHVGFPKQ